MRSVAFILGLVVLFGCNTKNEQTEDVVKSKPEMKAIEFTLEQANQLANLPLDCIQTEYPNKLGQTLANKDHLGEPSGLHPAFYGCFDWHSAVHGHWSLVKLLNTFPELEQKEQIIKMLQNNLQANNIAGEIEYFKRETETSYERTYGWAWLLKLQQELNALNSDEGKALAQNLQPLTDLIVERYIAYLPKLVYPIRVGEHTNTAFGLSFAYDYAKSVNHTELMTLIEKRAKEFYFSDTNCPITWEPSGYDFLSPCLEEIDLMRRVLSEEAFFTWIKSFLPKLKNKDFSLAVGEVGDRTDGKLVHLDGLNFSRAWVFYGLAKQYPKQFGHLQAIANEHMQYSYPNLVGDSYEGGHWLGSFAIYALTEQ